MISGHFYSDTSGLMHAYLVKIKRWKNTCLFKPLDIYDQFKSIKQMKYNEVRLLYLEFCDHAHEEEARFTVYSKRKKVWPFKHFDFYFYFSPLFKNLGASFLNIRTQLTRKLIHDRGITNVYFDYHLLLE
jgi:hypothetical protein